MTKAVAKQVADLLNMQNQLTVPYTAAKVLEHQDRYLVRFSDKPQLIGTVEVKKVQWYQCEIDHLSVYPDAQGQGIAKELLQEAESRAKQLGARIAQCTIKVGNKASEGLFTKFGYNATMTFLNQQSGNRVTVYQKVLVPAPEDPAEPSAAPDGGPKAGRRG
jgi:ribosomal protein S18 acetylase RimI-like enzyme